MSSQNKAQASAQSVQPVTALPQTVRAVRPLSNQLLKADKHAALRLALTPALKKQVLALVDDALKMVLSQQSCAAEEGNDEEMSKAGAPKTSNTNMAKPTPNEPGWVCSYPDYGTWFLPYAAVVADWKKHEEEYRGSPVTQVCEEAVQTWFREQITWLEVYHYGVQLKRPNMDAVEKQFMQRMKRDVDTLEVVRWVSPKKPKAAKSKL